MSAPSKTNLLPLYLLLPPVTSLVVTIGVFSKEWQTFATRLPPQLTSLWMALGPLGWLVLTFFCSFKAGSYFEKSDEKNTGCLTSLFVFLGQVLLGFAIFFVGCASNFRL